MTMHPDLQLALNAVKRGRPAEAVSFLSGILAKTPSDVQARWLLIQVLENQEQQDLALGELHKLLPHVKKDLAAIDRIADHFLHKRYPLKKVLSAYKNFLAHQPGSAVANFNYAYYLSKDAQFGLAIEMYSRALNLGIDAPEEAHLNIANICMDHLSDHAAARKHLLAALAKNPSYASAYYNLGNLAEREGDREEAGSCFQKCLQLDAGNESALARLADTHRFTCKSDPLFEELQAKARQSRNADLLLAAGRACEQLEDFDTAWQFFSKGKKVDALLSSVYRWQKTQARFHSIMRQSNRDWLAQFAGQSHESIFICGMFRTGSTLLEQVLAAHPAFTAGGEREFFPRLIAREFPNYPAGLDNMAKGKVRTWTREHLEQTREVFGESSRTTDKRPDNFLYLGLIKAVLPSARFIVTERDWRDVAASIYSVRLGHSQPYATNLKNILHYIGLQTGLIDHWESVLGPDLIRIRYEDLVLRPQPTVAGLLNWLGETWDDRCLSFHELKNSVKTASVWQVREPLHSKSIGRWKKYKQPFEEAFGADLTA
jgi:tetratricopeptide (TPR) repeat protein